MTATVHSTHALAHTLSELLESSESVLALESPSVPKVHSLFSSLRYSTAVVELDSIQEVGGVPLYGVEDSQLV